MVAEVTKVGINFPFPQPAGPACLVAIYGQELGRRWMIEGPTVIGRDQSCQIILDSDSVSRRHCMISPSPSGHHVVEDLNSTNGTIVNNEDIRSPRELQSGDHLRVGGSIFKYLDGESLEVEFHEAIYRMTIVDGLTNAYNKRYLLEFLEKEMSRSVRYGRRLSLMMIDVDHFKQVNDTYGHLAGDQVLRSLASLVLKKVRREECFARYGGEEFALVLPEAGVDNVMHFAEKLRALIENADFTIEGNHIPVTISVGVAQMEPEFVDPAMLIAAADERLLQAKREGRNRVIGPPLAQE